MKKFASVLVLALMAVLMLSVFAPALAEEAAAAATDSAIPAKAIAAAIRCGGCWRRRYCNGHFHR